LEDVVDGAATGVAAERGEWADAVRREWRRCCEAACDAQCDALSPDRVELLARAVLLVAGMAIPENDRAAVLARVVASLSPAR